jgi:hypothetical protein
LPRDVLAGYRATFSDINPIFLERLAARVNGEMVLEDIEDPTVQGSFEMAIAVLVLEHVDWQRAVAGLAARSARIFAVIQENPAAPAPVALTGTMAALAEVPPECGPKIVDPAELAAALGGHGFELTRQSLREVANGKRMRGLDFRRGQAGHAVDQGATA